MADEFRWYNMCHICGGDGVVTTTAPEPPYEVEDTRCPKCLGPNAKYPKAGLLYMGWMEKVS